MDFIKWWARARQMLIGDYLIAPNYGLIMVRLNYSYSGICVVEVNSIQYLVQCVWVRKE